MAADLLSQLGSQMLAQFWPLIERGAVKPQIYRTFPLVEAAAAHALLESSDHIGKIVLSV